MAEAKNKLYTGPYHRKQEDVGKCALWQSSNYEIP